MTVRPLVLVLGLAVAMTLVACGSDRTYTDQKTDDEYHLDEMALTAQDVPSELAESDQLPQHEFDNADWSNVIGSDDPEAEQKSLDAQGRVRNYVAIFVQAAQSRVLNVTGVSTLYTTTALAKEAEVPQAARSEACGVPMSATTVTTPFDIPKLGDESSAFLSELDNSPGAPITEVTICFRTGRILHAVQGISAPGPSDAGLVLTLAEAMLSHINASFDGHGVAPPTPEPTQDTNGLVPVQTGTAGATQPAGTQAATTPTTAATAPTANSSPVATPTK